MTAKLDGLSWTAIAAIAGFCVVVIMVYGLIYDGIVERIDALQADVDALQADMTAVQATLARIEQRQIAATGGQSSATGTTLAQPRTVSDGTADENEHQRRRASRPAHD